MSTGEAGDVYRTLMGRWRTLLQGPSGGGDAWAASAGVFDRLLAAQADVQRTLGLSLRAWADAAAQAQAGGDWSSVITRYGSELRDQLLGGSALSAAAASDQWQAYVEQLRRLAEPARGFAPFAWAVPGTGSGGGNPFASMFPGLSGVVLGDMLDTPSVGPTREFNEKVQRGFEAWVELTEASTEYQTVLVETSVHAFEQCVRELVERGPRGATPQTGRELAGLYMEVAERVFAETFATERYIGAQARWGNAGMRYLSSERAIVDSLLKIGHLATRTEVDAAHRESYELRKELRVLRVELESVKRTLGEQRGKGVPGAAARRSRPARKKAGDPA